MSFSCLLRGDVFTALRCLRGKGCAFSSRKLQGVYSSPSLRKCVRSVITNSCPSGLVAFLTMQSGGPRLEPCLADRDAYAKVRSKVFSTAFSRALSCGRLLGVKDVGNARGTMEYSSSAFTQQSPSLFAGLEKAPPDPVLGLQTAYKACTATEKVDLGVGAYRTEEGKPYVFECVRKVEMQLAADPSLTKEYLPIDGLPELKRASQELLFGENSPAVRENRVCSAQSLSGTGALRVAAEFIRTFISSSSVVYMSDPTWANHPNIFKKAGLEVATYPYWNAVRTAIYVDQAATLSRHLSSDIFRIIRYSLIRTDGSIETELPASGRQPSWCYYREYPPALVPFHQSMGETKAFNVFLICQATRQVDFDGMMKTLEAAAPLSVVLLHTCAHNPTGVDLNESQWKQLLKVCKRCRLIPILDTAYQGYATGDLKRDRYSVELFCNEGNLELFACQSFAKNMGLYGERAGALHIVCATAERADVVLSQVKKVIRPMYSNPPLHAALIASKVLTDPMVRAEWEAELKKVAGRILSMRAALRDALEKKGTPGTWKHITDQIGMFSYTGLTRRLRS